MPASCASPMHDGLQITSAATRLLRLIGKRLKGEPSNVSLHETQKLIQHFSFDSYHLTTFQEI